MTDKSIFFESINNLLDDQFSNENINSYFKSSTSILLNTSKSANIKDKFHAYYFEPNLTFITFLKSEKTDTEYHLMYDRYLSLIHI